MGMADHISTILFHVSPMSWRQPPFVAKLCNKYVEYQYRGQHLEPYAFRERQLKHQIRAYQHRKQ